MRLRAAVVAPALLFASLLIAQAPQGGGRRAITEKDLFEFNWIGDPQVSPDGTRVVFVRVTVNERRDNYDTSLWTVPTAGGEPQRLTSGRRDASPRWSPDGKRLAFVRAPEPAAGGAAGGAAAGGGAGTPRAQIYILSLDGGEAQQLTSLAHGASGPAWSPDGKSIAFQSDTTPDDTRKAERQRRAAQTSGGGRATAPLPESSARSEARPSSQATPQTPSQEEEGKGQTTEFNPEHDSDVRVISRAVYRANGAGYLDPTHPEHLWVVNVPAAFDEPPTATQLTTGKYQDGQPLWSHDGSQIYFTSTHVDEPYYDLPTTTIWSVAATGGEAKKMAELDFGAQGLSLSPDGTKLAFRGDARGPQVQSYTQPDLWVMDVNGGGKPKNLTASFDYDVGSGVGGDQGTPRGSGASRPIWTSDGRSLIDVVAREGRANLVQFDAATGAQTEYTKGNQAVETFRAAGQGRVLLVISTPTNIGDLFLLERPGTEPRRLTNLNQKLFSQLNLTEPEEVWYSSFDGKRIQAWIQKPPDFDPSKKYPLILNIHGGPHAAYGFVFDHEFQWMAAKGYVVLYPNPRGSTSYGQEFGNVIQYHYPGDDYRDLMLGVDEILKRGYIDAKKLGVTGGSGGGLLTNWTVGHTDRFAAGVAQRDIADWSNWWYTADFTLFQPSWFRGAPFDQEADFKARSPITYIKNVKTPMMFVLGEADYRTPPTAGGEEMFRALKFLRRPAMMVRFPGESHELSRSGQPWHRVERLQHIVFWFDKWLQGRDVPAYRDVTATATPVPPQPTRNERTTPPKQ
jgi:dipeptidyl aminopeptidase/acylaminoacyl peptidase